MSASRDKSQKTTFLFSNLYEIYKRNQGAVQSKSPAKPEASEPAVNLGPATSEESAFVVPGLRTAVLKADDLRSQDIRVEPPYLGPKAAPKIESFNPPELIGKRVAKPEVLAPEAARLRAVAQAQVVPPNEAIASLKQNLQKLNDLHARLRFMLQELESLVKE